MRPLARKDKEDGFMGKSYDAVPGILMTLMYEPRTKDESGPEPPRGMKPGQGAKAAKPVSDADRPESTGQKATKDDAGASRTSTTPPPSSAPPASSTPSSPSPPSPPSSPTSLTSHPAQPIPPAPFFLEDHEKMVDFRKPGFLHYSPAVFGFFFCLFLLVLFTIGGGGGGFFIGLLIFIGLMALIRYRFWASTGYWFTDQKMVIHDGMRISIVPYDEVALSSITFEKDSAVFQTIYNREVALRGIEDIDQVVAFITRQAKRNRDGNGGKGAGKSA
jgi:hypothetical protein